MIYEVTGSIPAIDFAPDTVASEVIQNVRALLATMAGTVPLDRDLGVSWSFVDAPMPQAVARVNAEVVRKIQRYEPRARVLRVTLDESDGADGRLVPRVSIEVR